MYPKQEAEEMKRKKKKLYGTDIIFLLLFAMLFVVLLWFGIQLILGLRAEKKVCQSLVALNKMEYNEDFLEEAQKIRGIRSITPVLEIPVKLRAKNYTMDAVWLGVDLSELNMKITQSNEMPIGSTPILLLGKGSLAAMVDNNGHTISEKKQKEFLEQFKEIEWQYCMGTEEDDVLEEWKPCLVAGILSNPSEDIYLSYEQARVYTKKYGNQSVPKVLLTVQGEENYKQALCYFMEEEPD